MREKKLAALGLAFITAFSLAGCGSAAATGTASSSVASSAAGKTAASGKSSGDDKAPLIVGSKDFTESIVLGEIYAEAFEDNDVPVKRQLKLGSQVIHDSIKAGDVEFYPEYTGTGLNYLHSEFPKNKDYDIVFDPQKIYDNTKAGYEKEYGITWLKPSDVNDSEGLAASRSAVKKYGLSTFSDAWEHSADLKLAGNGEFFDEESTYPHLVEVYGKDQFKHVTMDHTLEFQAAKSGDVDVISVYTTEGNLESDDYVVLKDDKQAWCTYWICPIIRDDALARWPKAQAIADAVTATLTDKNVIKMNADVDIDGEDYEDVAHDYYDSIKDKVAKAVADE
ncbi:ABC transporter substrate-binding protein [Chordicoccus furentiruminis]|uniref:ABC transporter substrate-binding protein n=1 Tax=Chordicoccus furentiruminis TaxID=2709410 RepID=UPI0023A82767|nr:glycine betaine ABC transporter substrate-binding protein [Chordicoccus furentiruminis]